MNITIFEDSYDVENPHYIALNTALRRIKEGRSKSLIEKIRNASSSKEVSEHKKKLPSVMFSGEFREPIISKGKKSYRNDSSLTKHSHVIVLDFDHVENPTELKEKIFEESFVYAAWVSPSGQGVKALVVIEHPDLHRDYFDSLKEKFPDIDPSGRNEARLCFESYDPDILIKEDGQFNAYTDLPKPVKKEKRLEKAIDWKVEKVNIPLNMIKYCADGEKHDTLLRASHLMGGYITGNHIDEDKAIFLLEQEISRRDIDSLPLARKTIRDGIEEGKKKPLHKLRQIEKTHFLELNKLYYSLNDSDEELMELYHKGLVKGYHVGFDGFKDRYTVLLGSTTYIYAAPYSGKSIFLFEVLINLSLYYGLKHAIFSSEMGSHAHIFAELCQMYAQKDFFKGKGNQMSEPELYRAKKFIRDHFYIVDPADSVIGVEDFYGLVSAIEREYNIKIHTTTIDPWNEINHKIGNTSRDLYLEDKLGYVRRISRANNWHNFIVTHIQKPMPIIKDKQPLIIDGVKYYYPPTMHDVAGGEAWARKGMSMIGVWRPPPNEDRSAFGEIGTYEKNESVIFFHKIKPKGVGSTGKCTLFLDFKRHRYYEMNSHGDPVYSHRINESKEEPSMTYVEETKTIEAGDIDEQF